MGYFRSALKGVSWVLAFRVSTRVVSFGRTIILARMLSPAQLGVFGIASLFITLLEIFTETGINVFLIQKRKNIKAYLGTAWVVSIARGILISLALIVSADFVSQAFSSPGSKHLIYLISLVSLIRGFINPAIVNFQKELRFAGEFRFRFVVFIFDSAVAVIASLVLRDATGIVLGLIAGAILELVMSFIFVPIRPKLNFSRPKFNEIMGAGRWLTGAGVFQFLFRQGDDAVVGKILGESALGTYQVAYKISSLPVSEIADVFTRALLPVYVKIASDKERIKKAFIKTSLVVSGLALVLGAFIFVFGEQLVVVILGPKWSGVMPLVKILSIFGVVQAISNSSHSLLLALGKQKEVSTITFVSFFFLLLTIVPLTLLHGLSGAVLAPLIGSLFGLPLTFWYIRKALK